MNFRKRRVVLNRQHSSWTRTDAGVRQGSILETLLYLIYINDLSDDLTTHVKLMTLHTFLVVHNMNTSTINVNNDLNEIRKWTVQ